MLGDIAREALRAAVHEARRTRPNADVVPPALREERSCFVTLRIDERLRGCVGSLTPTGPLVHEVARSAYSAALHDPRFPPVTADELAMIRIHIAVLTTPEPVEARSEEELLAKLRVGVDGVTLRDHGNVGTFLPAVWSSLPDPRDFVRQLKVKAGLSISHWSDTICVERYQTESFVCR